MEKRGSQGAVLEKLGISLSKGQSAELYQELCDLLVTKDAYAYVDLLRVKYELLKDGVSHWKCDYIIMENLLEMFESEHPLILASVAYMVSYKS